MPGMITVDQQSTFSTPPLVMSAGRRFKFGTSEPDVTRDGERKWVVQVAVAYFADYGRAVAEVVEVGLTGDDPTSAVQPGMPVQFDRLRVGVSAPEKKLGKDGNERVVGGKLYWQADAVRPFSGSSNGRQVKSEVAA